jgi:N-methylhydantoinase B
MARMTNVEMMELFFPIIYLFRRLCKNAAGAGRYRGGLPPEFAIMPYRGQGGTVDIIIVGNGITSTLTHGLYGYPGSTVRHALVHSKKDLLELLEMNDLYSCEFDDLKLESIDISWGEGEIGLSDFLYTRYEGAGGFGDPLDRNPKLVQEDVLDGVITISSAKEIYGVEFNSDLEVDFDRTNKRRELMKKNRLRS